MNIPIDEMKSAMDQFDPAALFPDISTIVGKVELAMRLAVLIGPILLLIFGLIYFFAPPKEANHYFGYRCYFGMGSVNAWRFTQRLAGLVWAALGLVLTIIMLIVCASFRGKEIMDLLSSAAICIFWEAGLVIIASIVINILVAIRFNKDGELRAHK